MKATFHDSHESFTLDTGAWPTYSTLENPICLALRRAFFWLVEGYMLLVVRRWPVWASVLSASVRDDSGAPEGAPRLSCAGVGGAGVWAGRCGATSNMGPPLCITQQGFSAAAWSAGAGRQQWHS